MIEFLNSRATDSIGASGGAQPVRTGEPLRVEDDFHPDSSFFAALRADAAFGAHRLDIRVGDLSARITGLSSRQRAELAARYGIFSRGTGEGGAAGLPVDIEVALRRSPRPGFLRLRRGPSPEIYRLLTKRDGGDLLAWSYEWAARFRFGEGTATLVAVSDERVVFDRIVENFLRVGFAHLALEKGGFLLHAAGVVRDGRAFVFFGPSGSGKTTVTSLAAGDLILSDDLLLIAREPGEPAGGGGPTAYVACSVPFRGAMAPPAVTDRRFPLAGLFRLVKAGEHRLEDLTRSKAVGQVVQSLPFVTDRPEAVDRILEVVSGLVAAVPVRALHFRKDAGFWRVVEHAAGCAAQAS